MNKACLGNVFNPLEAAYFWGGGKMFGPRRGSYSPLIYLMEGVKVFQNLALGGRDFLNFRVGSRHTTILYCFLTGFFYPGKPGLIIGKNYRKTRQKVKTCTMFLYNFA
jgi:hypothetical protein